MAGFDIAHLERRIAALEANRGASLRFGKVTGVEGGYARVQLADGHGMVSMPLATLHRRVLRDQDITMPDQGEPVAVLFSGQGLEAGVVLGAVYSPAVPDPAQTRISTIAVTRTARNSGTTASGTGSSPK